MTLIDTYDYSALQPDGVGASVRRVVVVLKRIVIGNYE